MKLCAHCGSRTHITSTSAARRYRAPRVSRAPSAAFRLAQDVVTVRERRQLAGMDHPMQTHHQRLALDVELRLVEIADDVLHRQPDRVFRQDVDYEIFNIVGAAAARR